MNQVVKLLAMAAPSAMGGFLEELEPVPVIDHMNTCKESS